MVHLERVARALLESREGQSRRKPCAAVLVRDRKSTTLGPRIWLYLLRQVLLKQNKQHVVVFSSYFPWALLLGCVRAWQAGDRENRVTIVLACPPNHKCSEGVHDVATDKEHNIRVLCCGESHALDNVLQEEKQEATVMVDDASVWQPPLTWLQSSRVRHVALRFPRVSNQFHRWSDKARQLCNLHSVYPYPSTGQEVHPYAVVTSRFGSGRFQIGLERAITPPGRSLSLRTQSMDTEALKSLWERYPLPHSHLFAAPSDWSVATGDWHLGTQDTDQKATEQRIRQLEAELKAARDNQSNAAADKKSADDELNHQQPQDLTTFSIGAASDKQKQDKQRVVPSYVHEGEGLFRADVFGASKTSFGRAEQYGDDEQSEYLDEYDDYNESESMY